jgi:hypothetical protein
MQQNKNSATKQNILGGPRAIFLFGPQKYVRIICVFT